MSFITLFFINTTYVRFSMETRIGISVKIVAAVLNNRVKMYFYLATHILSERMPSLISK